MVCWDNNSLMFLIIYLSKWHKIIDVPISSIAHLLIWVAEYETGLTWRKIHIEMDRLHIGEFSHKEARILQYMELPLKQRNIFNKFKKNFHAPRMFKKIEIPS